MSKESEETQPANQEVPENQTPPVDEHAEEVKESPEPVADQPSDQPSSAQRDSQRSPLPQAPPNPWPSAQS